MIINGQMVISTNLGYLATKEVEYDGVNYTINEFFTRVLSAPLMEYDVIKSRTSSSSTLF